MNTIDALTRDCFNAIIYARRVHMSVSVDAPAVHQQVREQIDRLMGRAMTAGMPHDDVYDVVYAVTALADAVGMRGKGPLATYWRDHLLQMHYFNDADGQDGFFTRLDAARRRNRVDVLQVYATCLALGFRGRLRGADAERALTTLQAAVQPAGWVNSAASPAAKESRPWQLYWVPLGALMVCLALYVIFSSSMRTDVAAFAGYIDALLTGNS